MNYTIRNSVIRDNIEGNRLIHVSDHVRRVLNSSELQRLRHVKQTGLASLVFPGAEHSRFAHSLGVYATATTVFDHLQQRAVALDIRMPGYRFDTSLRQEFLLAALCHDIGHTAFSHVLERTLLPEGYRSHEECTRAVLESDGALSKAIDHFADREAVQFIIQKKHANRAISDLISGSFDVDRCDYVLRDSAMAGVEYGKYDLKWLVHSLMIGLNVDDRPILVLDGPRGLDALRQFLSARRYLHKQVYLHAAVRGAQILLKSIFERLQDVGPVADSLTLVPQCLHPLLRPERKITLGEFLDTTDVQINYMVYNLTRHSDATLAMLANLLHTRHLPVCVLDSGKLHIPIRQAFNILDANTPRSEQFLLFGEDRRVLIPDLISQTQEYLAAELKKEGLPEDAAQYMISYDIATFRSEPPRDLYFAFGDDRVAIEDIAPETIGFDFASLTEEFSLERLFAPRAYAHGVREFIRNTVGKHVSELP